MAIGPAAPNATANSKPLKDIASLDLEHKSSNLSKAPRSRSRHCRVPPYQLGDAEPHCAKREPSKLYDWRGIFARSSSGFPLPDRYGSPMDLALQKSVNPRTSSVIISVCMRTWHACMQMGFHAYFRDRESKCKSSVWPQAYLSRRGLRSSLNHLNIPTISPVLCSEYRTKLTDSL